MKNVQLMNTNAYNTFVIFNTIMFSSLQGMLGTKKKQISTQLEIVTAMKDIKDECPNEIIGYLIAEKTMSLAQANRLENIGLMGAKAVFARNLDEQNQFYNSVNEIMKCNNKCFRLKKFLQQRSHEPD